MDTAFVNFVTRATPLFDEKSILNTEAKQASSDRSKQPHYIPIRLFQRPFYRLPQKVVSKQEDK
jgi:hypothetical protein